LKLAFISLMSGQAFGGSEVLWTCVAALALKKGHSVTISVYDWGKDTNPVIRNLSESGAEIFLRPRFSIDLPPLKKIRNYIENRLPGLKKEWKFLLESKPDHVLINQGGCFDLVQHHLNLFNILQQKKITYSLISHSHPQFSYIPNHNIYPIGQRVFLNAKLNIFISNTQQEFVKKALNINLINAHFSWNPLNLKNLEILPWPESKIISFAMVGGLVSGKGQDIILEILSQKKWKERDWILNIYGSGYGFQYLNDRINYLNLGSKVNLHGQVRSATEIWKNNHVLLFPSSEEGMPISIVEALISGRLVISSDIGGIAEILEDNNYAFLSEAPSLKSFERQMEKAWNLKSQWKEMGELANKIISSKYTDNPQGEVLKLIVNG
jgi:glycosyltransferase involved in cell wall biosynthesis